MVHDAVCDVSGCCGQLLLGGGGNMDREETGEVRGDHVLLWLTIYHD